MNHMHKWRVGIVEDEPIARVGLRRMLESLDDAELVGEAGSAPEAHRMLDVADPEILFLDVQLPGGDAFDVLARAPAGVHPTVVLVTAFEQFAVRAFDFDVVDFLLKPFDESRFRRAWERAVSTRRSADGSDHREREDLPTRDAVTHESRLLLRKDGVVEVVALREVEWIEADDNYVVVHTATHAYRWRMSLVMAAQRLCSVGFVRAHRSVLVNSRLVVGLHAQSSGDGQLTLYSRRTIPFSRRFRSDLENAVRTLSP